MRKLLTSATLVMASCLFLPSVSMASINNHTIDLIFKSKEGDVLKQSEDKILISATREGDVMKEGATALA